MACGQRLLLVLFTLLGATLLAGCAEPGPGVDAAGVGNGTVTITSPDDYSYLENGTMANGSHVHDYWGGKDRLEIMNAPKAWSTFVQTDESARRFRPPAGSVIPQGTRFVHVTATWTENPGDVHAQPELRVQTQQENAPFPVGPLTQGETITIEVTNAQNDLPHQTLSAWIFDWVITPDNDASLMRYQGEITLHVVAERGLDIPLYPGHPDQWEGATALPLLEFASEAGAAFGSADGQVCFFECYRKTAPADGAVVPQDAHHVEVVLTQDPAASPLRLDVAYHGADTREFALAELVDEADGVRTYHIPVGRGMGDGPYATQSLWEFMPVASVPVENGAFVGSYSLTARAVRDA